MPRNALMHALQAGSNAVAGGVSAPVDGIAWALRKAGVPVPQNALMGSQWMEDRGFTSPVPQGMAQVAGETLAGVAPFALAARAPQVANALLRGGENLAARQTLNPQTGAVVWHGSPHKFDAFDSSKIGTGEGAQAYGHGLYLADNPKVAEAYQNAGIGNIDWENATYGGRKIQSLYDAAQRKQNLAHRLNDKTAISKANAELYYWESLLTGTHPNIAKSNALDPDAGWPEMQAFVKSIDDSKFKNINFPDTGLYKVDLPDEHIARMLDWDAPLSQQAPEVRQSLRKAGITGKSWGIGAFGDGPAGYMNDRFVFDSAREARRKALELRQQGYLTRTFKDGMGKGKTGADLVRDGDQVVQGDFLRGLGIPGIRYLDGGSRGAGTGTRNYVVFPGEENALRILERNGQLLK